MDKGKPDGHPWPRKGIIYRNKSRIFGDELLQFSGTVVKTPGRTEVYFGNARNALNSKK